MEFKYKISIVAILSLVFAGNIQAAQFNPAYIISDEEMNNYSSMNQAGIQSFLNQRKGTLNDYLTIDKENNFKTAPQAFYEISQRWQINPKYLLVLVQKEQSLLDDSNPSQGQYDRATGYGCPDSGGCDDRWKGFYRQVNSAAAQTRYYMDNIQEFFYQPGKTYKIDDQNVVIKNKATAALYNYTPHIHGNLLFYNLYNKYFGSDKKWPDGSLLQASDGIDTYLIKNGQRRRIVSKALLMSSFDAKKIIKVSQEELDAYADGVPIKYHNYSLLRNAAGSIYLIVDDQKRLIQDSAVLKNLGFKPDEITDVTDVELSIYSDGPVISSGSFYPTGALFKEKETANVYYILNGEKKLVTNMEILNFNFKGQLIKKTNAAALDQYMPSSPVLLPDGELVKTRKKNTVYVIANGQRLPIASADAFNKLHYSWKNIKTVSDQTLELHPLGASITGVYETATSTANSLN